MGRGNLEIRIMEQLSHITLMYHCVYDNDVTESGFQNESSFLYKINAEDFEKQVCSVVTYCNSHNLPLNTVEFTFDDGGCSFHHIIAPILERYGIKGVFFISTFYIDTPGFLTRKEIEELVEHGHFIGSHSHSHPDNLSKLTEKEISGEWKESCGLLKAIVGDEIKIASIPNGYESKCLFLLAKNAGVDILYTSAPTTSVKNRYGVKALGRYVVHNRMTNDEVLSIIADKRKRKFMYARWRLLSLAKAILGSQYYILKKIIVKYR